MHPSIKEPLAMEGNLLTTVAYSARKFNWRCRVDSWLQE